jgi:hypothetical protein
MFIKTMHCGFKMPKTGCCRDNCLNIKELESVTEINNYIEKCWKEKKE